MAGFNEIQVGRFNRMLQKLLSLKGRASMNELSSTLQPVLAVFHGVENRSLEGWSRFGVQLSVTGGAGATGAIKFRNPAAVNALVVFEKIQAWLAAVGTADQPVIEYSTSDVTDLTTATDASLTQSIDSRQSQLHTSMIISHQTTTPVGTGIIGQFSLGTTADLFEDYIIHPDQEIILAPAASLMFVPAHNALTMNLNMLWRERFLEDSERTG